MKHDDFLDALQYIDDALLESAADSMTEKKRYILWPWLAAAAACVVLAVGIWALAGGNPSQPNRHPALQDGSTIPSRPVQMMPTGGNEIPTEPPDNHVPNSPDLEYPICPDPPVDSPVNPAPSRPVGFRPLPETEQPVAVPKYDGAGFTAQEVGALFSGTLGNTIYYEWVGFPTDDLSDLPSPPGGEYINIYQNTNAEAATEDTALGVMYDILPRLEHLLGRKIPTPTLFTERLWSASLPDNHITVKNYVNGIEISCKTGSSYITNYDDPALKINGITLSAKSTDTDQQVMEAVAAVIPYLETLFDMELSSYKIYRDYAFSDDLSYLSNMTVYLYADGDVVDDFLEQYEDTPRRFMAGELLCLTFSRAGLEGEMDTVICRQIEFISQTKRWVKPLQQRKLQTLAQAEALLAKGYVFCGHYCLLCMQEQDAVDFCDYDWVSLEYAYGKNYGIPFYVFYKKLADHSDGSVRYAKTMVPAVDVTGMEEYFENQLQYHNQNP